MYKEKLALGLAVLGAGNFEDGASASAYFLMLSQHRAGSRQQVGMCETVDWGKLT